MYVLYNKGTKNRYCCVSVCVCVCISFIQMHPVVSLLIDICDSILENLFIWALGQKSQVVFCVSLRLMPGRSLKMGQCEMTQGRMKSWKNLCAGLLSALVITECFILRDLWTCSARFSFISTCTGVAPLASSNHSLLSSSSRDKSEHSFSTLTLALLSPSSSPSNSLMCS